LGWIEGGNLLIEHRLGSGDADLIQRHVAELVALAPDVIVTAGSAVERFLKITRIVPIVFVALADPVGSGIVETLSRPGGNATGFMQFEYNLCVKWPELLKQVVPGMKRVAVLRDPEVTAGVGQFAVIQSVAPALGVEVSPINLRNAGEIERAIAALAASANAGFILTASAPSEAHRDLIIRLAARHKLPAIYPSPAFGPVGGLISYGPEFIDQFRGAAGYVDRILKGEKPADLPVQAPSKYRLVINLKTANALGLTIPATLLVRADEVIE
jgi:putative ABC transport system substrate-binding protein